jgi:hypothetical protein
VATSALPALINALVTNARANTALADVDVYDGFGVTSDPAHNILHVGVDDVNSNAEAFSGYAQQEWANANHTSRDEEGHVVCAASSWNGDGDAKAARDNAFATVAAVENMLRTNTSQGVSSLLWTSMGGRIALSQWQDDAGATAVVIFTITYRARI